MEVLFISREAPTSIGSSLKVARSAERSSQLELDMVSTRFIGYSDLVRSDGATYDVSGSTHFSWPKIHLL